MNLLADENIDAQVVAQLRQDGHLLLYAAELATDISDSEILSLANKSNALLITTDRDFAELVFRQGRLIAGVIYPHLPDVPPAQKASLIATAIRQHGDEFANAFVLINPSSIRIRK